MLNLARFRTGRHGRYQSSEEILAAIERVAGRELPLDGDETQNEASRMWEAPAPDEQAAVIAVAWSLAPPDESQLFWGQLTLARPVKQSPRNPVT
jgi:hypothetical protein